MTFTKWLVYKMTFTKWGGFDEQILNMPAINQAYDITPCCTTKYSKTVHTGHNVAMKQLVLPTIKQLAAKAKEWPQMKLITTKIIRFVHFINDATFM